jgi:hypothetical protein
VRLGHRDGAGELNRGARTPRAHGRAKSGSPCSSVAANPAAAMRSRPPQELREGARAPASASSVKGALVGAAVLAGPHRRGSARRSRHAGSSASPRELPSARRRALLRPANLPSRSLPAPPRASSPGLAVARVRPCCSLRHPLLASVLARCLQISSVMAAGKDVVCGHGCRSSATRGCPAAQPSRSLASSRRLGRRPSVRACQRPARYRALPGEGCCACSPRRRPPARWSRPPWELAVRCKDSLATIARTCQPCMLTAVHAACSLACSNARSLARSTAMGVR